MKKKGDILVFLKKGDILREKGTFWFFVTAVRERGWLYSIQVMRKKFRKTWRMPYNRIPAGLTVIAVKK